MIRMSLGGGGIVIREPAHVKLDFIDRVNFCSLTSLELVIENKNSSDKE